LHTGVQQSSMIKMWSESACHNNKTVEFFRTMTMHWVYAAASGAAMRQLLWHVENMQLPPSRGQRTYWPAAVSSADQADETLPGHAE